MAASLLLGCLFLSSAWADNNCNCKFTDVSSDTKKNGQTIGKEIINACKNKWAEGYSSCEFGFDTKLNRAEFSKMLVEFNNFRKKEYSKKCFPDVKIGEWYSNYICTLEEKGIVEGYPDGYFHPSNDVNFAEASKMILISLGYEKSDSDPWYEKYTDFFIRLNSRYFKSFEGNEDLSIKREDMIHMITLLDQYDVSEFDTYYKAMIDIEPYHKTMSKKTGKTPANDIGGSVGEIECGKYNNRVQERKICSQRFEKGELAIVYNKSMDKIDFVVPFVPLFSEYFGGGSNNTCPIYPSIGETHYNPEPLFGDEMCEGTEGKGRLCGNSPEGCAILAVGMMDYYYSNKRISATEINHYNNTWLPENKQNDGCKLKFRKNKKYMLLSNTNHPNPKLNGQIDIGKTFSNIRDDKDKLYESKLVEMENSLNNIGKLQDYIATGRPVILQYKYDGIDDHNTHTIVIVGKNIISGNYIVQDPYFNVLLNDSSYPERTTMFLTLKEAIDIHLSRRDTTDITFKKLVFYYKP